MRCNHCGQEIENNLPVCPECGYDLTAAENEALNPEAVTEEAAEAVADALKAAEEMQADEATPETSEETIPEEAGADEEEPEAAAETAKEKREKTVLLGIIGMLSCIVVALLIVIAVKYAHVEQPADPAPAETEPAAETGSEAQEEEGFKPAASYQMDASYFTTEILDTVVCEIGVVKLDNRSLCYAYWDFWYDLVNYYGSYLNYYMDPSERLDTQAISDEMSWDQYLMTCAMENHTFYATWYNAAMDAGFELSGEYADYLSELPDAIRAEAEDRGYTDAEAYMREYYGPYATIQGYMDYQTMCITGYAYYETYIESYTFTDEELEAGYAANAATYEENGIQQIDVPSINIRHILIMPEDVTLSQSDAGYEAAVADAREAARLQAEALYKQWLDGEATEETFSALAETETQDPGSQETGGLYEDVFPGQMVDAFNDWCFDTERKPGDHGIVETSYGFHIMYFVGTTDEIYWRACVADDLRSEKGNTDFEELCKKYPTTLAMQNAGVYPCNLDHAE